MNKNRKWTTEEEDVLLRYVEANPHNLHKCFERISEHLEEIGHHRTVSAVQAHWYAVVSKREDALCFFTASSKHVSKNRKNGEGTRTSISIWRRFLNILRNL